MKELEKVAKNKYGEGTEQFKQSIKE